jgi:hypothetical protein
MIDIKGHPQIRIMSLTVGKGIYEGLSKRLLSNLDNLEVLELGKFNDMTKMGKVLQIIVDKKPELQVVIEDVKIESNIMLSQFASFINNDNLNITWKTGEFLSRVKLTSE